MRRPFRMHGGKSRFEPGGRSKKVQTRQETIGAAPLLFFFLRLEFVVVYEGFEVPVRERQRIALSRFSVVNPKVIIFNQHLVAQLPPGIDDQVGVVDAIFGQIPPRRAGSF